MDNEIFIYGGIGDEVFSEPIVREIAALKGRPITIKLNSPGGSVHEAEAIVGAMKAHDATVTVSIDALAASSASYIAAAADHVEMVEGGLMMLHSPYQMVGGNAAELRRDADLLEKIERRMITVYAAKSGQPEKAIAEMLKEETWFDAREALDAGFVDEIIGTAEVAANISPDIAARAPARIRAALAALQHRPQRPSVPNPKPANVPLPTSRHPMTDTTTTHGDALPRAKTPTDAGLAHAAVAAARARENERVQAIRAVFAPMRDYEGVGNLEADCLADAQITVEAAQEQLLGHMGRGAEPLGGAMGIGDDRVAYGRYGVGPGRDDGFVEAASDAICVRYGIPREKPHAAARDLMGASVKDLAQSCLSRAGRRADDFGADGIIRAAQTTSDFPKLLENVAEKSLISGLESEGVASHRNTWTKPGSVSDFKPASRVALGDAPDLKLLHEDGEVEFGAIDEEGAEHVQVETYARIVSISRKALINDDLGALTRTPLSMGMAAARKESDLAYGLLSNNPKMRDGNQLFSAAHGNLASIGSDIAIDSLGAARAAMRKQRSPGSGSYLNIQPMFLLVGADRETEADQLLTQIAANSATNAIPDWVRSLTLVVDPRLDSDGAWYVAGNPLVHDTLEVAYLGGRNRPQIQQQEGFEVPGMSWRCLFDCGVAAIDWRALYKVPAPE